MTAPNRRVIWNHRGFFELHLRASAPPRLRASALALAFLASPLIAIQGPLPPATRLSEIYLPHGAYYHVPPHNTLIVDAVSNDLGGLFIEGEVVFDPLVPVTELRAAWILVGTTDPPKPCKLQIGSASASWPSTASATITLLGMFDKGGGVTAKDPADPDGDPQTPSPSFLLTGSNALNPYLLDGGLVLIESGQLIAYGAEYGVPWTELEVTADPGATALTVASTYAEVASWAGMDVVLASSDFDAAQAETFTVASVGTGGGTILNLQTSAGCTFRHYALDHQPNGTSGPNWSFRERAEVGLLSRNVTIQAQKYSNAWVPAEGEHGHVILGLAPNAPPSESPLARVSWVEFRDLGVLGKLGRYPLHFHMLGDQSQLTYPSFVRDCSFRSCYNKFLTVHATQNIEVTGNVGFGTVGSGFYLEDRDAQGILLAGNLGLGVRPVTNTERDIHDPPDRVGDDDLEPAVYWYVSPLNRIESNRAAGSSHYGFWYKPEDNEPALIDQVTTTFADNEAHSNGHHGFYQDKIATKTAVRARPWYDPADPDAQWSACRSWKNRRYGFWLRSYGNLYVSGLKAADNRGAFYFASDGFQNVVLDPLATWRCLSRITMSNSLAIGETGNFGYVSNDGLHQHEVAAGRSLPQPVEFWDGDRQHEAAWAALTGVEIYDGLIALEGVRFADYSDRLSLPYPDGSGSAHRRSAGISQVAYDSQFMADPRNRAKQSQFANVVHRVGFRYPGAQASGANMIKTTLVYDKDGTLTEPSLGEGYLMSSQEPFLADGVTSTVLPNDAARHVPFANEDYANLVIETPSATTVPYWIRVTHSYPTVGASIKVREANDLMKYPFNLLMNREYAIEYLDVQNQPIPQQDRPQAVDLALRFAEREDQPVIIAVPWFSSSKPQNIGLNLSGMSEYIGIDDLRDPRNNYSGFFWDSIPNVLYLKIFTKLKYPSIDLIASGTEQVCTIRQQ